MTPRPPGLAIPGGRCVRTRHLARGVHGRDSEQPETSFANERFHHGAPGRHDAGRQVMVGLVGRDDERARLASLVAEARGGTSGVLVVTGPAGIGKTSLLRQGLCGVPGFVTVVVEGVESEAGLAYSALH